MTNSGRPTAVIRHHHDTVFDHHVVFNGSNGTKMRYTKGLDLRPVTRASAPELLDVKTTDYCPFGCPACYQDSTLQGQHARIEDLAVIAQKAGEAGVFEVAIGGGEPTLHPQFIETLQLFSDAGVVPNFTTRNPRYLRDNWDKLYGLMGGFALSVDHRRDVDHLADLLKGLPREDGMVNLHVIMGLIGEQDFIGVLAAAKEHRMRVTLLGYKTNGRGSLFTPEPHPWWLQHALNSGVDVSIDTALALKEQANILAAGVPQLMFHTTEGHFSAYVDAVKMTLHPSSYDPHMSAPFGDDWLTHFMTFAEQPQSTEQPQEHIR